MLELPPKFKSALGNGIRTSLFPVIRFYKDVRIDEPDTWSEAESVNLSIKDTNLDGIAFDPLLLNAPSINSSADIINNKYTISTVSLSISNAPYRGKIFSDDIQSLLNAVCQVYYCANGLDSLEDCLLVYTATVRRFNQSAESMNLTLEDITEQMLTTQIPSSTVPDEQFYREDDKGKPYPMVYGYVDRSPLVSRFVGLDDMGELQNQITKLHIDKRGMLISGLWTFPNEENYGSSIITENHDLVENGWLTLLSYLSVYSDNFTPILQNVPDNWGDEDLNAPDFELYNFQQSNGTNSSASVMINADAIIVSKDVNGIPTRVFRPIEDVECFTYCDNNQDGDKDALNRIWGFTNYYDENMWEPWEFSQNVSGRLGYEKDWGEGGTTTWWEPTACNYNVNGGVFSSIDNRWLSTGRDPSFPVDRLQNGSTTDGIYLGGRNPDGVRGQHNKSGGAYIRMIFDNNVGDFPCITKIVYDAEYHSFFDMRHTGGHGGWKRPYAASFWFSQNLEIADGLPDTAGTITATDLMEQSGGYEIEFPNIPNNDGWQHIEYSSQDGTEDSVIRENGWGVSQTFDRTNSFNSLQFGVPQLPIRGTTHGNDTGYCAVQLFNCYTLQDVVIDNPIEQNFYADVVGRFDENQEVIVKADKIMEDILKQELNYNGTIELFDEENDWWHSFTLNEQKEAKEVFQGLFKSSLIIPSFDSKGQFKFIGLKQIIDTTEGLPVINNQDIIKYSFELSKIDDVYNQVNVKYKKNYGSGTLDKQTGYFFVDAYEGEFETYDEVTEEIYPDEPEKQYSIDYYGLKSEETKLEVETEYIRDEIIARKLQKRLVSWYANQHLITKIVLPVKYMDLEVGDYIKFDELLGGKLAFGQDYTINTNKNGQLVYPVFFITKLSKSLQKVSIEAIQIHRGEYGFPDNWEDGVDGGSIVGNGNWDLSELFEQSDYEDHITTDEDIVEEDYFNVFWDEGNILPVNDVAAIIDTDLLDYWNCDVWLINTSETFIVEHYQQGELEFENQEQDYEVGEQSADTLIAMSDEAGQGLGGVVLYNRFVLPDSFTGRVDYVFRAYIGDGSEYSVEIPFYQISSQGLLGDVNGDGGINVLDVVMIMGAILNNTEDELENADINGDGIVNVQDLVALVNEILGQ